jgi:uncharacterized lipoprotein YbaY
MFRDRTVARRIGIVALVGAMLGATLAIPVVAATGQVTGSITIDETVALSAEAVTIVTVVDLAANKDAGAVVGEQRIDGASEAPVHFSVPYDPARIDPKHPYGLFATIADGSKSWQNEQGVAVLTGGPTDGVDVIVTAVETEPTTISGTITKNDTAALGPDAVAIAALIKEETGTLVERQVQPFTGATPVAFTIGYDPSVIDPGATYVVKAGIVDGSTVYENKDGVAAISDGAPASRLTVPVDKAPGSIPVTSPFPTANPTPTEEPTEEPTTTPTEESSAKPSASPTEEPTEKPTATPTEAPTPTEPPTAEPTATPSPTAAPTEKPTATPSPSPSPTAAPTASPSPSPSPTPSPTATSANPTPTPVTGTVTGTLTYVEPHELSAPAFAVVVLVEGTASATQGSIIATQVIQTPGAVPIDFRVVFENSDIDPKATYTVQAGIVDGSDVWTTAKGTKVVTNGAPSSGVALTLAYQPDLIKGEVSGSITGVGIQLTATAYSVAVLLEPSTGESLGMDVNPTDGTIPTPFAVPFSLDTIDPAKSYVVTGEVVDGSVTWANTAGVPVITNGNALSDVQVVVTPVAAPSPSPLTSPDSSGRGDVTPAFLLLLLALIVGGIGFYLVTRSRRQPPAGPQSPDAATVAESPDAAAESADGATTAAESPDAAAAGAESPDGSTAPPADSPAPEDGEPAPGPDAEPASEDDPKPAD